MRYSSIKNTDLKPSAICLGTASIGVEYTEKEGYYLLDFYLDQGGNFIDTAHVYSNWMPGEESRSERILGDWMEARKNREKVILATKGAHPELTSMNIPRMSRKEVEEDLNGSLKKLKTDYIDIYYLHRDDPSRPVGEILDMLHDFQLSGKIRYYACSNWTPSRIRQAIDYAEKKGYTGFIANQMLWNIGCFHMKKPSDNTLVVFDQEMYNLHKESGMAAIPYSSQANGYFSKLDAQNSEERKKAEKSLYNTSKNRLIYNGLKEMATRKDLTIAELVLAYIMLQPFNAIPVVGCRNVEQLRESLKAAEMDLSQLSQREFDSIINIANES